MKKLTIKQAETLYLPGKMKWLDKYAIEYYAYEKSNVIFITRNVKVFWYLVNLIPTLIIQFFYLLFDGGLREFRWPRQELGRADIYFDMDDDKDDYVREILSS